MVLHRCCASAHRLRTYCRASARVQDRGRCAGCAEAARRRGPVEAGAGIGLAARRDVLVAGDVARSDSAGAMAARSAASAAYCAARRLAFECLRVRCRSKNRCSARGRANATRRRARRARRSETNCTQRAVAPDEEVRRHRAGRGSARSTDARPSRGVGEQPLDRVAAVLAGRQADGVHHQQVDRGAGRPRVEVRRRRARRAAAPAVGATAQSAAAHRIVASGSWIARRACGSGSAAS